MDPLGRSLAVLRLLITEFIEEVQNPAGFTKVVSRIQLEWQAPFVGKKAHRLGTSPIRKRPLPWEPPKTLSMGLR